MMNKPIPRVLLVVVGLALLQGFFTFWGGRLSAQTSEGIAQRLRDYLYDHIQRLSFRYHDKAQTGELIQRSTSDVDAIRRFFAEQAVNAGRIIMLFVINFMAILRLDAGLAFFSVLIIPIVLIVSIWFFKRISQTYEAHQEQEAGLSTALQENLTGVRVVKAFARQDYERDKFENELKRILKASDDARVILRVIGSLAFQMHCPRFGHLQAAMGRAYTDIDFASYGKQARAARELLVRLGYSEDAEVFQNENQTGESEPRRTHNRRA